MPLIAEPIGVDLLQRYPTKLTAGDTAPENARSWEFTGADIFHLSHFKFEVRNELRVETGSADLGIGHCSDGAVWAVVIPHDGGTLTRQGTNHEAVATIWLRFHPGEIARLFPPETVSANGSTNLASQMRRIANHKMISSWQADEKAMIPEPKDLTVDIDTQNGWRRFFDVDTAAQTAQYWDAFEKRAVPSPAVITTNATAAAFDQLWETYDKQYAMFVLRPEVDWVKLRDEYRPQAIASQSATEFAEVCADLLKPLRDLHIWITLEGEYVPVFNRPRSANSNPDAHQSILGSLHHIGRNVQWAVTGDKIGFIAIYGWDGPDLPDQCQQALEQMRETRGLIVDVRLNGGGGEDLAREFAGRFVEKDFIYAYSQFRNGPNHTNLTEKIARTIKPGGPWRYNRPVVLLIGQKCMSSNESFIGMMTGDPDVTTMGDHTCGSSGNPQMLNPLPGLTVSMPQWIDYLPDGTVLDEHGFLAQVPFLPTPGAFSGNRDDLLTAALERLRPAPLPEKPIPGPAFMTGEEAEVQDESRPKVVSVFPADGAQSVETATELRITFDRPMDPLTVKLDWKSGGIRECEFPSYDVQKYEFTIPVHMIQGMTEEIEVNNPMGGTLRFARAYYPRDGFESADHRLARLYRWKFNTEKPTAVAAGAIPPRVLKISPTPGSTIPYRTFLEVQFDQPMKSPADAPPSLPEPTGMAESALIAKSGYDAATHTFRLPLLLKPNNKAKLELAGFCSATGIDAEPLKLEYQVSDQALSDSDQEEFDAAAKNPRLLDALESMQRKRENISSLDEQVQTLSLSGQKGLFTRLTAQSASFKWQKPDRLYGDVADIMSCPMFAIGSDGQNWWWIYGSADRTNLTVCPAQDMQKSYISICDPFDLTETAPKQAAAKLGLRDDGKTRLGNIDCRLIEHWDIDPSVPELIPYGSLTQWFVDAKNGLPAEVRSYYGNSLLRERFTYLAVNKPLAASDFTIPKLNGVSPAPPEALDNDYTNRFINLRDGSDGNMSLRWGKTGPKGRSSGGLN